MDPFLSASPRLGDPLPGKITSSVHCGHTLLVISACPLMLILKFGAVGSDRSTVTMDGWMLRWIQ